MVQLLSVHAAAKSLQSCSTLCDPIDSSPPSSSIPRILQARTLEWVAISFSNAWKWKVKVTLLSHVWLLCDPLDGSPPGSSIPRILQARTLEWVAISFSNAWKWKVQVKSLHRVRLFVIPWTVAQWLLHPWDIPGKSTGMRCHCLLQYQFLISNKICVKFASFSFAYILSQFY